MNSNNMIESFIIGLLVNLSTEGGKLTLKKLLNSSDLEVQINNAYERALKKWSVNKEIRRKESFWTATRLKQLFEYIENPTAETNFDKSTQELIDYFYQELQKEQTAWHFIQSKHFKTTITKLNTLEQLLNELKNEKLKPEFVFEALKYNAKNQIKRQISSGKYIPNTFIETNELKDHLRYFVTPLTFYSKIFTETKNLNFSHLNRINKLNEKEYFSFDITSFKEDISEFSYNEIFQETSKIIDYLDKKHTELEKQRSNLSYAFTRKIENSKKSFEFINSKAILLTDNAGQGKTNLLCDFVDNVLLKRDIPTIFLNGFEIDANEIGNSIARRIFPNDNYSFNEIVDVIEKHSEKKQLIIIIDGINENTKPKLFSKNLETFIEAILQKSFIKIILSCRTEYYENNFQNLINASFKNNIKLINGLNNRLDKRKKEKLLWTYFNYFNIKIDSIDEEVEKLLVDNFLLLRIFSEVNKNKHLPELTHIYKTKLFSEYYKLKVKEINKRFKENDEFDIEGNISISKFIERIAEFMISNEVFHNIPLDEILKDNNKEVYIRFLDENILLRKDLKQSQSSIFGRKEVINFTFDEFRDFIISDYLINKLYSESKQQFEDFIKNNLTEQSPILEGCSIFIYSLSRKINDNYLNDFLKEQPWYNYAFLKVIFNTPDKEITSSDKDHIKQIFIEDKSVAQQVSTELNYKRYNSSEYSNLNINLLFEIFDTLTNEQFNELVYPVYQNSLDDLIKQLYKILDKLKPKHYVLFKHLLYFLPLSNKVKKLYYDFYKKTGNTKFLKDLLQVKSSNIVNEINKFIEEYDIQL